ncbi:MAG: hypothetical protein ACK4ND_18075 [Cytophagaceae bacterium]
MKTKLEKEGNYEIFETTKGNEILVLNEQEYFAITEGNYGHILVKSKSTHEKKKTLQKGNFYLADFKDNPEFDDIPHLFLQEGKKYKEFILPKDLPTNEDKRKKLIITEKEVTEKKIKEQVKRVPVSGENRKSGTKLEKSQKK